MVQMAFKRCQLGRDKHEDREVLYEYIDAMSQGDTADLQEAGLYHQPNESLCPNDANICTDTLVCRGSYQSISDTVTCAVKIRPVESKTLVENLVRLECNHKNICGMINAIETSKSHYLILQLCVTSVRDAIDASKLSAMIGDRTPLQVCGELIEAIETLHSKKFIHGNVCPANVLLDESGTPKLCGFSSAVQLRDDGSCTMCTSRCTPGYLPPEILDSEETQNGTAVDAFGVGCTMFAILSGEELYQGESSKVINAKVAAGDSRLDTLVSLYTARNLIQGLVATDPLARPQVAWSRTHPLFWTKQQALQYLANVGGNLQVGIARNQDPFVAELEAAVDSFIGAYNEEDPSSGGSWAELLDSNYPIGGDWGKMQRAPEVDERNYHIFGNPPKKKQVEARERLLADGKPLGPHQAKEIRTVGLLKFARNLNAHKAENVETGRFESEEAIADYILSSLPWLLMTVHTLDAKYNEARMIEDADKPQSQEDKTLRMSFATNAMRSTDSAIWSSADESASR
jgi:serine/threonine protein kinase